MIVRGITIEPTRKAAALIENGFAARRSSDGWLVTVVIPNVADTVPVGSLADLRARDWAQSGPSTLRQTREDQAMIPLHLAQQMSLTLESSRSVIAFDIALDDDFNVVDHTIMRAEFTSYARLSYDDVADEMPGNTTLSEHLRDLFTVAVGIRGKRFGPGAVFGEEPGEEIVANLTMHPGSIIDSELSVLANAVGALRARDQKLAGFLYRNQVTRNEAIAKTLLLGKGAPLFLNVTGEITNLEKAQYGTTCLGQVKVGVSAYAHIVSPLRRYCDLVNQRALLDMPQGELHELAVYLTARMVELAEERDKVNHTREVRRREREAQQADKLIVSSDFSSLTDDQFRRVVWLRAAEIGVNPDFDAALLARIDELSFENLAVIIFAPNSRTEPVSPLIRRALARITAVPASALTVLETAEEHFGGITSTSSFVWQDGFAIAKHVLERDGERSEGQATRRFPAGARVAAAIAALGAYARVTTARTALSALSVHRPRKVVEHIVRPPVEQRHPRLILNEIAQAFLWSLPTFSTTGGEDGQLYTATAVLTATGQPQRHAEGIGTGDDQRSAEYAAAQALLSQVCPALDGRPTPNDPDVLTIDPVSTLADLQTSDALSALEFDCKQEADEVFVCRARATVEETVLATEAFATEKRAAIFRAAIALLTKTRAQLESRATEFIESESIAS